MLKKTPKIGIINIIHLLQIILKSVLMAKYMGFATPISFASYIQPTEEDITIEFFKDYMALCSGKKNKEITMDAFLEKWLDTSDLNKNEYFLQMMDSYQAAFNKKQ